MELGEGTSNSQAKLDNALGIKIYDLGGISSSKKSLQNEGHAFSASLLRFFNI